MTDDDPEDPEAAWRRCAGFLRIEVGLTMDPPEKLLDESRTIFDPHSVLIGT